MAVHSAASAGHEDIVRIILEADNLIDLNTPTFDTKETLAHLAAKHGHRGVYRVLSALGADLRIKDGTGRRVCDVTTDRAWASDIADSISVIEGSEVRAEGARNRDALFRHQGSLRQERLRKSVSAQRDEERRRAFANASTNNANTADSGKKRSKKKGKKGKAKGNTASPAEPAAASAVEDSPAEVSNLLQDLLLSAGSGVDGDDGLKEETLLGDSLENTAAMFARLRDVSVGADSKSDDVKRACELIEKLEGVVELSAHPSRLHSTSRQLRIAIASDACQLIHMMQKLYRVDHAAMTAPSLTPLQKLCDTTLAFTKLVVGTAQLGVSVDWKPQARELLDVLEKRLVKMPFDKREPGGYRELVQTYSVAREAMGMGRTSSPDSLRALEWYLVTTVDSYELQVTLDSMDGRPFYFDLTTTASARQFVDLEHAIDAVPELDGVACFGKRSKHVVYGGKSQVDVASVRERVVGIAMQSKIHFTDRNSQLCTPIAHVGQFVFSATGITP